MDEDRLFLETLDDLESRLQPGATEYQVLGISLLLRMLLLDDLVRGVNARRDLPIRFVINDRQPIWKVAGSDPPEIWSVEDGFDPDTALAGAVPTDVTADELLDRIVMVIHGREIRVKDLLAHALYVSGGAHSPKAPRTKKGVALSQAAVSHFIGGYPAGLRSLVPIGRVVIKGLAPLRAQVAARPPP